MPAIHELPRGPRLTPPKCRRGTPLPTGPWRRQPRKTERRWWQSWQAASSSLGAPGARPHGSTEPTTRLSCRRHSRGVALATSRDPLCLCVERPGSAAAGRATRTRGPRQPEVRRLAGTKLLDDFIGATQYRRWDHHPECFRRREIDEQLEPRGLFHGKVARPGPLEKLVDVACRISELVEDAWTETHQSTGLGKLGELGSDWDPVPLAELGDPRPIGDLDCVLRRHDGLGAGEHRRLKTLVQIVGDVQLERMELQPESWRRRLDLFQFLNDTGVGCTPEHSQAGQGRKNLLQQLQAFGRQFGRKKAGACDVSSWPREAGDEPSSDRVANGSHHNGDRLGCLSRRVGGLRSGGQDDVDLALNELGGECG